MVRRVLSIVYREIRGLHQAAYVLALFTLGSQFLALVRDRMLAHQFGADASLDIYYAAFRIPDLLYVLFASTLSVYVLIPFVSRSQREYGDGSGKDLLSQIFSLFLIGYSVIAIVCIVIAPMLAPILFPGIEDSDTLVLMTRILLLQPLFLGISSLFGVVTQLGHRFVLYAVSPLIYNIGIIFGVVALYPLLGLAGLGVGVVLGALGHMLVQLPFIQNSPLAFQFTTRFSRDQLREVFLVSIPRALTLSLNQVVLLVLASFASLMAVGSVAVFQFAYNLHAVPLAVIGVSYSVAAFPLLSQLYADREFGKFRVHITTALRHIIFWSVPAIMLIVVLRAQIVRVVLGSGAFDWDDTRLTAAVLAILVLALLAHAVNLLVVRVFYAAGYTKIPFYLTLMGAVLAVSTTVFLSALYAAHPEFARTLAAAMRLTDVAGSEVLVLAIGYTIAILVQALALLVFAYRVFDIRLMPLLVPFINAATAAFVGGISAYIALNFLVEGINPNTFVGIFLQGSLAGIIGVAGIILTYIGLQTEELQEIHGSFRRKLFKTDVVAPQQDII
ncbi:MAG: lipid II flippase MurJ [Candidatus Paceibacterota bacterium]